MCECGIITNRAGRMVLAKSVCFAGGASVTKRCLVRAPWEGVAIESAVAAAAAVGPSVAPGPPLALVRPPLRLPTRLLSYGASPPRGSTHPCLPAGTRSGSIRFGFATTRAHSHTSGCCGCCVSFRSLLSHSQLDDSVARRRTSLLSLARIPRAVPVLPPVRCPRDMRQHDL